MDPTESLKCDRRFNPKRRTHENIDDNSEAVMNSVNGGRLRYDRCYAH
ncbi:hypothetical protein [Halocatena marina]|nr:hypothetical protein [Halocatena marina]